ncbi:MAG: 2-C-methyl-D-erythritol 2,4-cyclodiphosphate synthase, partial [Acidiferrobacterales bacterium]
KAGRDLILGGVNIPHPKGLDGHSDADVLIHAICDACLGAAALGDIGHHFPDSDPRYRGIDSRRLLRKVCAVLKQHGWRVENLDSTVVAQEPRLAPHIAAMRENIAMDLEAGIDRINIKATTTEKMGFAGREEGIAAHAVVLITSAGSGRDAHR